MKKMMIVTGLGVLATTAHAQSSVTLYGLLDAGVSYVTHAATATGSASKVKTDDGVIQGNRWGMRGVEDLGGGLKAIFTLEGGLSVDTGASAQNGTLFGRQAFVGLSQDGVGSFTVGRQYSFSTDYISKYAAGGLTIGNYAFRMNDVDQLTSSRINNAVKFASANFSGLTFGAMFGFSNQAGAFSGSPNTVAGGVTTPGSSRTVSFGANYDHGPFSVAAAYTDISYPGAATPAFPITIANVNTFGDKDLRTIGVGMKYAFGPALVFGNWTNTRFEGLAGQVSRFNNYEIDGKYSFTPAMFAALSYTYSDLTGTSTGKWNQVSSIADYALSKRTDVYLIGVYQKASGSNKGVPVQAEIGSSSSFFGNSGTGSDSQLAVRLGMRTRF
jgi:predicted porin